MRRGIADALEAGGYHSEVQPDLLKWIGSASQPVIVVSTGAPEFGAVLGLVNRDDPVYVIAVVDPATNNLRFLLEAGVAGIVVRGSEATELIRTIDGALAGQSVIPRGKAMSRTTLGLTNVPIASEEIEWLRLLANGWTVSDLSQRAGFSRRNMHRRLKGVYRRLGAESRAQAIATASHMGLI
jgi:DNA-binding NarL/FixJ family response regulator